MTKSLASEWDQFAAFMKLSERPPAEVATLRHVFLAGSQTTLNILVDAAKEMMATGRMDPFMQRGAELGREIDRMTKSEPGSR